MGAAGTDVILSSLAHSRFPFAIEAKNQEANKKLYDWYDQAKSNTKKGEEAVLFIKRNGRDPLVVIDAEYFIRLFI